MARKTRRGGKRARPGSVLEMKTWCVTPPPGSRVIRTSKKPYSEMSAEEKAKFCPPEDKVTSLPPLPPSPPPSNRSSISESPSDPEPDPEEKPLTALQKLAARKADVSHIVGKNSSTERKAYIWHGRPIPKGGKRSRKTKRKTHRRRR